MEIYYSFFFLQNISLFARKAYWCVILILLSGKLEVDVDPIVCNNAVFVVCVAVDAASRALRTGQLFSLLTSGRRAWATISSSTHHG